MNEIKVVHSAELSEEWDDRWVVVDASTGAVLDDAQGYGYKDAAGAHRAFGYKKASGPTKKKRASTRSARQFVKRWRSRHPEFEQEIETQMLRDLKEGGDGVVTADVLEGVAVELGVVLPKSAAEMARVW